MVVSNMREMKNSGILWIGEIPSDWDISPVKALFSRKKAKANEENPIILSLSRDAVKVRDIANNEGQLAESYFEYNPVEPGDFLLNPMDLYSGANCNVSEISGVISPAYVNLKANKEVSARYFDYFFKTQYWSMALFAHGLGVSFDNRWTLNNQTLMNYKVPLPNPVEQIRISDYIRNKVTLIDNIIEKTKQSIEEYKKLKQSIITEAVTKGLNPDVMMKNSGIEWIGMIPEHWEIKPFKYILNERSEKNNPIISTERLSLSIDKGVTLYSEKTTNLDRFKDDFQEYKIAHKGDLVFNSMNMIVGALGVSDYFGCVSPVYYTFYDDIDGHYTAKFCEYIFRSKTIQSVLFSLGKGIMSIDRGDGKYNTLRLKVSRDDLRSMNLALPGLEEQIKIIKHLNEKSREIEKFINIKHKLINELEVYKKSLIYEVVTGKNEVE